LLHTVQTARSDGVGAPLLQSLAGNKISWIPDPFFLTIEGCAKKLDFTGNPLVHVSAELGRLRGLKRLILKDCKLEALPATLSFCTALEHLDASNNPALTSVPPEMHNLTSLAWLDVSECALTSATLQSLFAIQQGPEAGAKPFQIKTLRLSGNKLAAGIPEALGAQLSNCLESLELTGCEIVSLPDSVCLLTRLARLDVSKNNLTALPSNIGAMSALVDLNVDLNAPLKDIPASFGQLTKLHHLSIANVRISSDSFGSKKAEIIDDKLQKFSRLIRMCLSSGGHPDLIFAMRYLATKRTLKPTLIQYIYSYANWSTLQPSISRRWLIEA
jgi:Leucine-rich repeat (LRR) protein